MEQIKAFFHGRPIYMNAMMLFCAYMTFIYMPFDLFYKPVESDDEIWFGYVLHGWAAKATEPIHWAIYGAGFWGFLKMKAWMFPWASLYIMQVAIAMGIFGWLNRDVPIYYSAPVGIPFLVLGIMLWRARPLFNADASQQTESTIETDEVSKRG